MQDAKYEDVNRSFSSELQQSAFLQGHSDWWSTGREAEKHTYTTTEHEWRDSKSGRGTFTGRTRRVQTHPPQYRTLKEYAHEYRVEKTGTRTVTKTRQVEVTKTDTKYVMQCNPYGICLEVPEEYTYTTTVTRTYTTTEEYTYTVTETNTYWSYQKFHFDDWTTGDRKRVKVEDAEYKSSIDSSIRNGTRASTTPTVYKLGKRYEMLSTSGNSSLPRQSEMLRCRSLAVTTGESEVIVRK